MPCNNQRRRLETSTFKKREHPTATPAAKKTFFLTFWEKFVLRQAASHNKVMVFALDLDGNDGQQTRMMSSNGNNGNDMCGSKAHDKAELDAATSIMMAENQAQKAAVSTSDMSHEHQQHAGTEADADADADTSAGAETTAAETQARLPPALLASLNSVRALSQNQTQNPTNSNSVSPSKSKPTTSPSNTPTFGPAQLASLPATTLHEDAVRQEALVRTRRAHGLSMTRRLQAEEEEKQQQQQQEVQAYREEDLVMSGALEAGNARCEVCAKREREVEGLVESGVVAL
ncbi:hypothetical protein Q7P37_000630 [Cladosporium fusiforme]